MQLWRGGQIKFNNFNTLRPSNRNLAGSNSSAPHVLDHLIRMLFKNRRVFKHFMPYNMHGCCVLNQDRL